ncbi:MAG: Ig-like domain-containing protein [Rhodospirillales bacterium]
MTATGHDTAVATVTVTGTNDGPVASDDTASAVEDGGAVTFNVLANDSDVDGDSLSVPARKF